MPELSKREAVEPPAALVPVDGTSLVAQVLVPGSPIGVVLIPRLEQGGPPADAYAMIALAFREKRFATCVVTLTRTNGAAANEPPGWLRPDIAPIADRIAAVARWAARAPELPRLPIGVFAIEAAAAGALAAAASTQPGFAAVAGFNARTDLVDRALSRIAIPVLLIASSRATDVLAANRAALAEIRCEKRLVIAPGNLRESLEGRAPRKVANLAARWFTRQITHVAAHGMR